MTFNLTISTTTPEDDKVDKAPDEALDSDNETEVPSKPKKPIMLPISINVSNGKPKRPFQLPNIKTTIDHISTTQETPVKRRPMIPSLISIETKPKNTENEKEFENIQTPVHTESSTLLSDNIISNDNISDEEENKIETIPLDLDELITRLTNNNCNYHRSFQIYGCPRNAHEFASNPDKYRNSKTKNIFSFAFSNLFSNKNEEIIEEEEVKQNNNNSLSEEEMIPWNIEIPMNEREIENLCHKVRDIFYHQPMLLHLEAPLRVVGDIHGQYFDLLRIFEYNGYPQPPFINYLFLGDYVDRGKLQMETIVLLFAFKCKYPKNFFLLRGNHESENVNKNYGFYDECKRRFSVQLWRVFCDVFNCLPVCAVIDEKIICMHGGLSPELKSLKKISRIHRPTEIPNTGGLLCDLLWSDPDPDISGWENNERGISWIFGADVVTKFLRKHDLDLIARAHQVVEDGYELFANRKLVTIFSAPAYCGLYDNCAAVMTVNQSLMCSFQILKPTNHRKRNSSSYTEEEDEDDEDDEDDEEEGNGDSGGVDKTE